MANSFTSTDVYGIVNAMAREMFGANNTITAIDTSTFQTIGEKMLRSGYTSTLNALSYQINRTVIKVERYQGRFRLIMRTPAEWGGIEREISFYAKPLQASGNYNTDINPNQLDDGNAIDHYIINKKYPLELNYIGSKILEYSDTTWLVQLRGAFRDEASFSSFLSGKLVDIANDIETKIEAENRLMVLNAIGATYNVGKARQKVNLTAEFNSKYGTSYTTAQLLTTYLADFVSFMVARIQGDMELMRDRNELFHIYPARNDDAGNALTLPRFTTPAMRRLILYMPLIRDEEKNVFPSLFNDSYLKLENYEGVEYWQNPNDPMAVSVTPNQLDVSTGQSTNGTAVTLDNVVGLLFHRDALEMSVKAEDALTTPVNARGQYYNTFYHWNMSYKEDQYS